MKFKKLIAGMTAVVMLASTCTTVFAESGLYSSAEYDLPLLAADAAVEDGYLVQLEANSTYEIILKQVLGDADFSTITAIHVDTSGTAIAELEYDIGTMRMLHRLGTVSAESAVLDLTDEEIDWTGSNYRLRFITEDIESPITISAVEFKDESGDTVSSIAAQDLKGISWQANALSEPVSIDNWEYAFFTNKDIRKSSSDVIPGEWIKVTCHATDAEIVGFISVYGYNGSFEYVSVPDSGEVYVRVTNAMVNNGIEFRGWNVTIESVQFQSAKDAPDARTEEKVLFSGNEQLLVDQDHKSDEDYVLPHITCGRIDAQPGDIIRVEFAEINDESKNSDGVWFDLLDRGWNSICGDSLFGVYGGLTETEFTLNAAEAQAIRENGLLIIGNNITIKKIVLCSGAERADIKDALAAIEYYDENSRDEYWLNLPRYAIDPDVYNSATINISGSGELEAFYYTDGEIKNPISLNTIDGSTLTAQYFPDNFCIAPNSGKVYIESIVLSDGKNEIVIESDFFDGYEAYAALSVPENALKWNNSAFITAKELKTAGAKAGDVLKFTAQPVETTSEDVEPYMSCCLSAAPVGKEASVSDIDGYTYWVLTQEMINKGIVLRGGCEITGISLCAKSGEVRNPVDETVQEVFVDEPVQFTHDENTDEHTTLMFGASKIYHAGDVLRLNFSVDNPNDCFLSVVTADYNALNNDLVDEYGNYDIYSGITWIDIPLSAEDVAKIEKMGFRIWGKGFTLNRAELVSETEVGRTSLLAEVWGKEYIINDPLSFLPGNEQVAYVVADVYGNDGFGDISYWLPTDEWIQGHPEEGGALQVGFEPWRFDFTEETPLVEGSQIFIQKFDDSPIYIHEVRFYNSSDVEIFTLDADNAILNVVPFTTLNDGDEFWLNPGYFLGEELYAQFDKMVIRTKGGNFVTAGYTASSGEYTETTATSTTLELSKSQLFEDMGVKLFAANGEVDVISVTYYNKNGEVLKVLDYTNVNENFIPPVPFVTLAKDENYVISPFALLTEEQLAQPYNIIVETVGDPACGGALHWMQYFVDKLDDDGNPLDPGYYWTSTEDLIAGEEWRIENVQ